MINFYHFILHKYIYYFFQKLSKMMTGQTRVVGSWHGEWALVILTYRYSLALTSISLKDFPFLYETIGGSLNISLSNGWFWIKCHLLIKMFLRLGEWYFVTKNEEFSFALWRFVVKPTSVPSEFKLRDYFFQELLARRRVLKLEIFSSNDFSEELVLRSLRVHLLWVFFWLLPGGMKKNMCTGKSL